MGANWSYVPFTEAVEIYDSLRKPINNKERASRTEGKKQEELFPYYGATGLVGYIDDYITEGEYVLLGEDGAPFLNAFADKAYIISGKTWVNNHAHILRSKTNNRFLYYYLNCLNYKEYVSGTTRLKLTQGDMKRINIPNPPIPEQERIVLRIDELFSELNESVENLIRVNEQLDIYKYAAIENALKNDNLSKIKENIIDMGQGWSPKCENRNTIDDDEWAVIKTTAVQAGNFIFEENKVLPTTLEPKSQHEIVVGDILITRAGPKSRCGVCCLVKKTKKRLINCDKVYRIKVDESKVVPQYLEYVLNSPRFIKMIAMCKTGGNDSGLNLTQERFLDILIPVPSIIEQYQIIEEIEARMSICEGIRRTVTEALLKSEAMRQSILKEAFEGRL